MTRTSRTTTAAAIFLRLRLEDALVLAGGAASAAATLYARVVVGWPRVDVAPLVADLLRLIVVAALAAAMPPLARACRRAGRTRLESAAAFLRAAMPFVMCIAVYTNLHDTLRLLNPHDIGPWLAAAEDRLFGGQPVVWAQRFVTPALTELFNLFYASFYLIAPSVFLVLWAEGRRDEARHALVAVVLCFYAGFVLYVVAPAAPPRVYLDSLGLFHVALRGGPITAFENALVGAMPHGAAAAAFPSLHAAVSGVSLRYAWRYCRRFFPVLLVFVIGLLVSTVYLRHHYVVDLLAGLLMVPGVVWIAPRVQGWWAPRAVTS